MADRTPPDSANRRHWLASASATLLAVAGGRTAAQSSGQTAVAPAPRSSRPAPAAAAALTLYTFGDSILDCGRYNERGIDPGQLLVRNDDALFPAFRGKDLQARGPARLEHRAVDGATVDDLARQARGVVANGPAVALVTIGGNDLLRGLAADDGNGNGVGRFEETCERFLRALPIRPVLLGTVYDPSFGNDAQNFLSVPAPVARRNHRRVNEAIGRLAERYGKLADLHAHFLRGEPSWFTRTIEPSLVGASEIRRVFLPLI